MNLYVIGYIHLVEGLDYPERYDVFVVATSLRDALDNARIYVAHEGDIVHSVAHTSVPPISKLRFTSAVRSEIVTGDPPGGGPK